MITRTTCGRRRGFALAELLLVFLLLALVAFLLTGTLQALQRVMLPPAVVCDAEVLAESPSFAPMPGALDLHRQFLSRVRESSAVYVFGGRGLEPADEQRTRPLARRELPSLTEFPHGLPLSAEAFQELYSEELGDCEPTPDAADFSILVLGHVEGSLVPTCLVQCRSRLFSMPESDSSWLRRETLLVDRDQGTLRYVFAEPADDRPRSFVGAVHTWYRRNDNIRFGEEGPAQVVFPDPWLFRGTDPAGESPAAESHFSYLLALGR